MELAVPFRAREIPGVVRIQYGRNEDPARWGYDLLGLTFDSDVARGFPVVEARVEYPAEGYAALMGWIQLVRYWVGDQQNPTVIADVAPQLRDARMPYMSFGTNPILFDAPAFTERNVMWRAWSFLTVTPDALMTPVVEPVCGFSWGYDLRDGRPQPTEVAPIVQTEWLDIRDELRTRYPEWTFRGEDWQPLQRPGR